MRWFALVMLVGCAPSPLYTRASERLGVHGKHLHLESADTMDGRDVYVFCRAEHKHAIAEQRRYDGACVTFVCPAGDERNCTE